MQVCEGFTWGPWVPTQPPVSPYLHLQQHPGFWGSPQVLLQIHALAGGALQHSMAQLTVPAAWSACSVQYHRRTHRELKVWVLHHPGEHPPTCARCSGVGEYLPAWLIIQQGQGECPPTHACNLRGPCSPCAIPADVISCSMWFLATLKLDSPVLTHRALQELFPSEYLWDENGFLGYPRFSNSLIGPLTPHLQVYTPCSTVWNLKTVLTFCVLFLPLSHNILLNNYKRLSEK